MKSKFKNILVATVTTLALAGGGIGGLIAVQNNRTAAVYPVSNLVSDYTWGSSIMTGGSATMDDIQAIRISSTQKITGIYVTEGQEVKAGDPIITFDTTLSQLELDRKRLTVRQLEIDLVKARKARAELNEYGIAEDYESDPLISLLITVPYVPFLRAGYGTEKEPYIFIWDEECLYDPDFINSILPRIGEELSPLSPDKSDSIPQGYLGDVTDDGYELPWDLDLSGLYGGSGAAADTPETPDYGAGDETEYLPWDEGLSEEPFVADSLSSLRSGSGTISPDGRTVFHATALSSVVVDPGPYADPSATGSAGGSDTSTEPLPVVYAVFEVRQANAIDGDILELWEICFVRNPDNSVTFRVYAPSPGYDPTPSPTPVIPDYGPTGPTVSSAIELQKMKADADKTILETESKLKSAQLEVERMEYELNNGEVVAKIDGIVKTIRSTEEALAEDKPLILLSAGGGFTVPILLSETDLDYFHIGDPVTLQSWESGTSATGTITAISEFPTSGDSSSYYYSDGNQNVSTYPVTVSVSEDANFREGEFLEATLSNPSAGGSGLYLMNAFLRTENGRSYVWLRAEDGTLTKRYVQTGRNLWGSSTEIVSGLEKDDYIAFPYGNAVREGAGTVESTVDALQAGM